MERDDFNEKHITFLDEAARKLDDYNAEISGTKSGRLYVRGVAASESRSDIRAKKARTAEAQLSALDALLANDPAYQALYTGTFNALRDAEAATGKALDRANDALEQATADMDEALDIANQLPNGTRVFRSEVDGKVYTEKGQEIDGHDAEAIVWRDNAPSYEELQAKRQGVIDAQSQIDALLLYQTDTLGAARDRLEDEGNPPSAEELEAIRKDILDRAPPAVKAVIQPESSPPKVTASTSADIDVPTL